MAHTSTIEISSNGKCQVKRIPAISTAFQAVPVEGRIDEALKKIEAVVRHEANSFNCKIDQSAFNNARGEWFEMFLSARFFNLSKASGKFCIFTIPNVSGLRFTDLFSEEVRERLGELETHLSKQGIALKMSNPDFVCVDLSTMDKSVVDVALSRSVIDKYDSDSVTFLDNLHRSFIGKCNFDSLSFVVSSKTSVRADRRYQFVHEGNIIKALTAHLQTRFWRTDTDIKYYALTNEEPSKADLEVLKTAAISSITNVFAKSVRAVDEVYCIQNFEEIDDFVKAVT